MLDSNSAVLGADKVSEKQDNSRSDKEKEIYLPVG
jgi:hypothetical protein